MKDHFFQTQLNPTNQRVSTVTLVISLYLSTNSLLTSDCAPGFYGKPCQPCSSFCKDVCDAVTGECTCKDNSSFAGPRCDQPCGENCDKGCTQHTFICNGCKNSRYSGPKCENPCPINCNCTCKQDRTCHGCRDSYYGEICNKKCSSNCYNPDCDESSGNCMGGCPWESFCEKACNQTDGGCTCKPGYKPNTCEDGM